MFFFLAKNIAVLFFLRDNRVIDDLRHSMRSRPRDSVGRIIDINRITIVITYMAIKKVAKKAATKKVAKKATKKVVKKAVKKVAKKATKKVVKKAVKKTTKKVAKKK